MQIKILGPGCVRCRQLLKNAKEAVEELGIEASIEEVQDVGEIMKYRMISAPGLVINGVLVSSGRALDKTQVARFINGAINREEKAKPKNH